MKLTRIAPLGCALLLSTDACFAQDAQELFSKLTGDGEKAWSAYLLDNAPGSVSAAGILDITGESVTTIENVRDVVVAAKGLGSGESKGVLALSITPARTSLTPMNLSTYANSWPARLLGSLTIGYAQGDATISSVDYERRAVSAETSIFLDPKADDPVVAYAEAIKKGEGDCAILRAEAPAQPAVPAAPTVPAAPATPNSDGPAVPATASQDHATAVIARARSCRKGVIDAMRWNRSQFSISYGTGWIKSKDDGGRQEKLGRTLVATLNYGFDHLPALSKKASAAITYRRSQDEPVLESLQAPSILKTDTSLATFRLTYGSDKVRGLAEVSDSRSQDITVSRRKFKQAIGLDLRIFEATWVNFRFGKQRKIDGTADEYGSLFTLSYSPTALLK
jgi:hypothetical protein